MVFKLQSNLSNSSDYSNLLELWSLVLINLMHMNNLLKPRIVYNKALLLLHFNDNNNPLFFDSAHSGSRKIHTKLAINY